MAFDGVLTFTGPRDDGICEQQPGESAKAYEAARLYFEFGAERSTSAVARKLGKSKSLIERWCSRWSWVERAAAWDERRRDLIDSARDAVMVEEARQDAQIWADRLADAREDEWRLAEALRARAGEILSKSLDESKWSLRDAAAMLDMAAKLVRLAVGELIDDGEGEQQVIRVEYINPPSAGPA